MDSTLSQLLAGLFQAHQAIDRLQVEMAQRDQRIAELEAQQPAKPEEVDGAPA